MEQLRLEYLAREERFILDGDRNELRTIKQELDELRFVSYYSQSLSILYFKIPLPDAIQRILRSAVTVYLIAQ